MDVDLFQELEQALQDQGFVQFKDGEYIREIVSGRQITAKVSGNFVSMQFPDNQKHLLYPEAVIAVLCGEWPDDIIDAVTK